MGIQFDNKKNYQKLNKFSFLSFCFWENFYSNFVYLREQIKLLLLLLLLLLNVRTLISTNGYVSCLRYGVNKTPYIPRIVQRILLVCIKTVFCNSVTFVLIPMAFNLFSRASAGIPRAPTTNGTTVTFMFHPFFSSTPRSKYFSIFSNFLHLHLCHTV